MKYQHFLVACLAFAWLHVSSQSDQPSLPSHPAQTIYIEAGGPGIFSLNYDSRFSKGENGIGGRIGIGVSIDEFQELEALAPVGINYLVGSTRHFFEVGAGVTLVFDNIYPPFGHFLIGYRYQSLNNGISFRAVVSPLFGSSVSSVVGSPSIMPGLSLGLKF